MTGERTIPNRRATDQAGFEIRVNGSAIPLSVPVRSIVVRKEFNTISSARIAILDGDPSAESFEWSNSEYFIPGNEIEILAGYQQDHDTIFKGVIVAQKLRARENSNPALIVECRDKAYGMSLGRKSRYFYDMSDSDILDEILSEYTLQKELQATSVAHAQMVQYNSSDWDFAVMRAEANNMLLLPDDGKLVMSKPDVTASEAFSVIYGASMIEFDGLLDARSQAESTIANSWSYTKQEVEEEEGSAEAEAAIGNLPASELASSAGYEEDRLRHTGVQATDELKEWADATHHKKVNAKVRARAKFTGTPEIKPGMVLDIGGLGERMNGKTLVWGITHEVSGGSWTIDAQLGYDEKYFHEKHKVAESQAGGLLPPVNGLEVGKVTAIEGDPEGEYRIRVKVPTLDNEEDGTWARIISLDAGNRRGAFFRPEIDDEVIVGFLNDDPRHPLVLGMMNSSALPAPADHSDDNHEKGFVTRSGMKIWFNDDLITTVIETPNGNTITLSDDEGKISIVDENGNTYALDSSGVSLEAQGDINISATGDINLEGTNISLSANAGLTAEGSASAELSSGGTATIQGSMVQIN